MNQVPPLKGIIRLPGDKSISHRVAMFGAIAEGTSQVENISDGGDVASTIKCLSALGVKFERFGSTLKVFGSGLYSMKGTDLELDCGNSGTSLRLLCGLLSGQDLHNVSLIGDESLSRRPHDRVILPLQSIGVDIKGREGNFTPVTLNSSKPDSGEVEMKVASAQVKSAVLLAGLYAQGPVTVIESEKTRDHTENMLHAMGANIEIEEGQSTRKISIDPQTSPLNPLVGEVPGDPSSAAFFGIAATIIPGSDLQIENILLNPTRIEWINILKAMGANIEIEIQSNTFGEPVGTVRFQYSQLTATEISENIAFLIDELPILSLAMASADGLSIVKNASELRVKESDRISVVVDHLKRAGVAVTEHDDGYEIRSSRFNSCEIIPDGDHRIAMTFTILNYIVTGKLSRENIDIVSTSFPTFFDLFDSISTVEN